MRNKKNRIGMTVSLFVSFLFIVAMIAPSSFAATASQQTTQTTATTAQKSEGAWEKMKDSMSSVANPLSEFSVRDAGVKPRIRPHLFTDTSFNSNPNALKKQVGAWQARVSPGLTVEVPVSSKLYTMVDYTYSFDTTQGPRYSANNNSHNLQALARYDFTKCTSFGVMNNFQISDLPDNAGKRFLLETVRPELTHRFGEKLSSTLAYQFQHYRDVGGLPAAWDTGNEAYNNITKDTFNDNSIIGSATYDVTRKLSVTPTFSWTKREFPKADEKDYWSISPNMAASYGLGAKTTLTGNFGWGYRGFRDGGYASDLIYGVGLNHLLGRKMTWGLRYTKTQQDTFDSMFIYRDTPVATNLDNYDRHFRVINVHRIGTSALYNVNEKNSINTFAEFEFNVTRGSDNVVSNDEDNAKKMETGIMYQYRLTRYMDLRLGYAFGRCFEVSASNPSQQQYTYHKVSAGTNIAF